MNYSEISDQVTKGNMACLQTLEVQQLQNWRCYDWMATMLAIDIDQLANYLTPDELVRGFYYTQDKADAFFEFVSGEDVHDPREIQKFANGFFKEARLHLFRMLKHEEITLSEFCCKLKNAHLKKDIA
jgi:hypothetical protein